MDTETLAGEDETRSSVSGIREQEMAVRLMYAERPVNDVIPDRKEALLSALEASSPGEMLYVLPTYTAMLEVREVLREDGHVAGFWQD